MPLSESTTRALAQHGIVLQRDVPLADEVYWRVGGTADFVANVTTVEGLRALQKVAHAAQIPVFVLGNGSNLLVSDAGVRGIVVRLTGEFTHIAVLPGDPPQLTAGAGVPLTRLIAFARRERFAGLGLFAGIPGTVGGAVRMNAGTSMGEAAGPLEAVRLVTRQGGVEVRSTEGLAMSYRQSVMPPGAIIASATFGPADEDYDTHHARMVAFLQRRKTTQPLTQPSCGSTFRNPPGDSAGRLIEAAALKGFTIGSAQVSPQHANFIVNLGAATAADVRRVIEHVQDAVERTFGVRLIREVHYAGDWSDWQRG